MRDSPNARRAASTTSCDVIPAGLSTRRRPSVVDCLIAGRRGLIARVDGKLATYLREELLDLGGVRDALVVAELDLGRDAEAQRATDATAQVRGHTLEALERGDTLRLGAEHAHEDLRVAEIA